MIRLAENYPTEVMIIYWRPDMLCPVFTYTFALGKNANMAKD